MTDTDETTLRNIALTHAINSGSPDTIPTAEKFLSFLKGPPRVGASVKTPYNPKPGPVYAG
jgi:hypothetical protein